MKDNHEEAANAAPQALLLCQMVSSLSGSKTLLLMMSGRSAGVPVCRYSVFDSFLWKSQQCKESCPEDTWECRFTAYVVAAQSRGCCVPSVVFAYLYTLRLITLEGSNFQLWIVFCFPLNVQAESSKYCGVPLECPGLAVEHHVEPEDKATGPLRFCTIAQIAAELIQHAEQGKKQHRAGLIV